MAGTDDAPGAPPEPAPADPVLPSALPALTTDPPAPPIAPPPPPPRRPRRPRVWTVFVVSLLALIATQVGAIIGLSGYAAILIAIGEIDPSAGDLGSQIAKLINTPGGLLAAVIPAEIAILFAALIPAWRSSEPWRQRLGLVRGTLPAWGLLILLPAQVFVLGAVQLIFTLLFAEPSQQLLDLSEALTGATGLFATVILFAMSVPPGIAEELLDRGYLQRRLIARWGPLVAIAISSIIFGIAHLDPQHAFGTALLGVWFGVVAWRTGAVWPSMVCHASGNFFGIALGMLAAQDAEAAAQTPTPAGTLSDPELVYLLLLIAASAPFFIAAIFLLRRCGRQLAS